MYNLLACTGAQRHLLRRKHNHFVAPCCAGMTSIAAIFRGVATAIPTASGFPKSCCSRRAWLPCWITTRDSCSAFLRSQSLASAREASVLAAWSGLGYYHRARRMHQAAKVIVRERGGVFPQSAEEWLALPGIGRYTAAAVASIAFDEPVAVVDGNVERVLQRLRGCVLGRGTAWQHAEELLDRERPGDFNQAMMELGATICTPRAPQCLLCPVNSLCKTRGVEEQRPQAPRKNKEVRYGLATRHDSVLLVQRPANAALMAGMWELPEVEAEQVNGNQPLLRVRHSITDTDYRVSVFSVPSFPANGAKWFTARQAERLALTGLARKILRKMAAESKAVPAESK